MALERVGPGSAHNVTAPPAIRPISPARHAPVSDVSGRRTVVDEAIDIHLGFDATSGHLAIVGGEVRIGSRLADPTGDGSVGSLVNFVA